jgi:xanthine dehydrogenase accessory factor
MAKLVPLFPAKVQDAAFVPKPADVPTLLETAADRARRGIRGAMATVLARKGSAPATPGQKLYAGADGTCLGTVGGGAIEREVIAALERVVSGGEDEHRVLTCKLGPELGMCCGGSVELLIEPLLGSTPCLIIGGGHVATAVAPLLAKVGFAVTVVDAREAWGEDGRIVGARCVVGEYDEVGREIAKEGVVLVMTHDHALDQKAIEWALKQGFAFVGGVGSRAKAERTKARLEAKGFPEADRERVKMPLGVSIGARLPDEIAVAIAAEMVTWRRTR